MTSKINEHKQKKDRQRILYVANVRIPNERAHGIQIAHTCEELGRQGATLTLITPKFFSVSKPSLSTQYGIIQTFEHKRIFAIDIPHFPFRYGIRNISFFISVNIFIFFTWIFALFSRERITVYVRGEVVLALIPLMFLVPIFFETHQIRNYERLYKIALTLSSGIIVVTERLKQRFIDMYNIDSRKIIVARDAVALEQFKVTDNNDTFWEKYNIEKGKKIVLYSGSLGQEKGAHTLAEAGKYVPADVHIVLVGGSDTQIEEYRKQYGTESNITILGRVPHTDVHTYICNAQVLILPDLATHTYNNLYTSPMKLFEYMASGVPIIASDIPSLREVLDEHSATFFVSGDAHDVSLKINQVIQHVDSSKEQAKHAMEIVSEYTWQKRAEMIMKHIETSRNSK